MQTRSDGYAVGPHGDNGWSDGGRSNYHKIDLYNQGIIVAYRYIYYPLANEVARGYSNASVRHNPCEHSRMNILQWILTKLGTYLVLKRIWNPFDFQGHRVKFLLHNILVNTLESTSFNVF